MKGVSRLMCATIRQCHTGINQNIFQLTRHRVLERALDHVHTYGWDMRAVSRACEEEGLSSAFGGIFNRGPVELVEFFIQESNGTLAHTLSGTDLKR
jgi:ubiquinone biosynthesis protein COQ9